ncbi:MAG TPA: hypothetical protein PLB62_01730 [Candidatus Sumerlaeota bacterium]|nr:hypothetical protein [Candidatus Sumerlaeota bacterium]
MIALSYDYDPNCHIGILFIMARLVSGLLVLFLSRVRLYGLLFAA